MVVQSYSEMVDELMKMFGFIGKLSRSGVQNHIMYSTIRYLTTNI